MAALTGEKSRAESFPHHARFGLRAAMVGDVLHVTGGLAGNNFLTSILAWDPVAESWQDVGELNVGRVSHAAVAVPDKIKCP